MTVYISRILLVSWVVSERCRVGTASTNTPMPLSDTAVRSAKSRDRAYKLTDERGLHLHVTAQGSKLWRWAYRFDGKQKLMALGQYPDVSLAQAREGREAARKLLASGTDVWWESWKSARSAATSTTSGDAWKRM